jgi:hypothetical protein
VRGRERKQIRELVLPRQKPLEGSEEHTLIYIYIYIYIYMAGERRNVHEREADNQTTREDLSTIYLASKYPVAVGLTVSCVVE